MTRIQSPLVREVSFYATRDGRADRIELVVTLEKSGALTIREKGRRSGAQWYNVGALYLNPDTHGANLGGSAE